MSTATEIITYRQWESQAKAVERRNLKANGRSLTFTSIERRAHSYVVEHRSDDGVMVVITGWRDAMKKEA